jgi:spermidine/putrescine-binding protein
MARSRTRQVGAFVVLAGVLVALSAGVARSAAGASSCKTLHVFTWEGEADPSFVKPFETKYRVNVQASYISTEDQELAKLAAGGSKLFDIVWVASDNRQAMHDAGVIKPLDPSKLVNLKDVFGFLKPAFQLKGQLWTMASDWGINPFIYDTSLLQKQPTGWNVLWSPALKGKVALWGDYSLLYVGASVLGYDKHPNELFNLTDTQLNKIKSKMLQLKPNVRKIWSTGGDLIQLFANHEVGAAMGWNYVYQQLAAKHAPVKQVVFKDMGGQGWSEGPALSSGISSACESMAYKYINYITSPKVQVLFAKATGYTPTNRLARKYMTAALATQTGMDHPEAFVKGTVIRLDPVDRQKYVKVAEEIQAGLG